VNFENTKVFLALMNKLKAKVKKGFKMGKHGNLVPCDEQAHILLGMQVSDTIRNQNTHSMQVILCQCYGVPYIKPYDIDFFLQKKQEKGLIGLNIGSNYEHRAKRWSVDKWMALANLLIENKLTPLFFVGPEEYYLKETIECDFADYIFTFDSFDDFAVKIGQCRKFISVDTFLR
jgi:hypothetical protein